MMVRASGDPVGHVLTECCGQLPDLLEQRDDMALEKGHGAVADPGDGHHSEQDGNAAQHRPVEQDERHERRDGEERRELVAERDEREHDDEAHDHRRLLAARESRPARVVAGGQRVKPSH